MKLWCVALAACGTAAADPTPPSFVKVGRCPNGGYMVDFNCPDFLTTPGLPAIDAIGKQVIVPWHSHHGLSTLPNLAVWVLSTSDGRKLDTIPVWSQDEALVFANKMQGTNTPEDLRAVTAAVEAKRVKTERAFAGYKPLPHCTRIPSDADAGALMAMCGGADHWKCGDLDVHYAKSHAKLALTSGGTSTTIDTRGWKRAPVESHGATVGSVNCIVDAARIPNTTKVVIQLEHACDDATWCSLDGTTFEIISR